MVKNSDTNLTDILHNRSIRVTKQRMAVLKALASFNKPVTIYDIQKKIKSYNIDLATVYRAVNAFLEKGIVTDVDFKDDSKRFELVSGRNHHHHVVCKICKSVEDIEECYTNAIERELISRGYSKLSHSLEFFGVCGDCGRSLND